MKVRANRKHISGISNRIQEDNTINNNNKTINKTSDLFESSYTKSQSLYYKTNTQIKYQQQQSNRINPFLGTHNQLETKRFDPKNIKPYKYQKMKIIKNPATLTFKNSVNETIKDIKNQYENKNINMHKLNQLKQAFLTNNVSKRNLKNYFLKFKNQDNIINKDNMKKIVKQFGFDANDDQISIMFKLTDPSIQNGLSINNFIDLMTKPNVYFNTLAFNRKQYQQKQFFSPKIHEILRNKFYNLKEAFKIYTSRGQDIDQEKFNYVMKKLDLTDLVITTQQRNLLFDKFKNQKNHFNAQRLICAIADQENSRIQIPKHQAYEFDDQITANRQKNYQKSHQLREFSLKNLSNLQYERNLNKANQILRQLRLINKTKNIISKIIPQHEIDRPTLKNNIEKVLQNQGLNFKKQQYQAFLGYLDFNKNGKLTSQLGKKYILEESQSEALERIQRKIRIPPPTIQQSNWNDYDEQTAQKSIKKITQLKMNPQIKYMFLKLDNDKDGYLSTQEFATNLQKMHILENWQINNLVSYMDLDKKGYLTLDNFANRFHIKQQLPIVMASKLKSQSCTQWSNTKKKYIQSQNKYTYNAPTKYSAWPERLKQSDLSLIQAPQRTGIHISETQRFHNTKNEYAMQQKKMIQKIHENKLKKIADWQNKVDLNIKQITQKEQDKLISRNYFLRLSKEIYQENCHR